jgi:hypothetical protein
MEQIVYFLFVGRAPVVRPVKYYRAVNFISQGPPYEILQSSKFYFTGPAQDRPTKGIFVFVDSRPVRVFSEGVPMAEDLTVSCTAYPSDPRCKRESDGCKTPPAWQAGTGRSSTIRFYFLKTCKILVLLYFCYGMAGSIRLVNECLLEL